jgi:predicted nucleic acid-binding protein
VYADSSALVKLIVSEPESTALEDYLSAGSLLVTSRIAVVEVSRAVALANPEAAAATAELLRDCMLVSVTAPLLAAARELCSATVRTLDAIHLASALKVEPDELLAYDRRLVNAALENGLSVASPRA